LISIGLSAQKGNSTFSDYSKQTTLDYDPIRAFSISFTHRYSPELALGWHFQIGGSLRFILNNPSILYVSDQENKAVSTTIKEEFYYGLFGDIFKIQFFYWYRYLKHFYFDTGPYALPGLQKTMGALMLVSKLQPSLLLVIFISGPGF
jgi:hypothetical protein